MVANIFDKFEARQSFEADKVFGETFTCRTMKAGINTGSSPDPDRLDFTARGIWDSEPAVVKGFKDTPGHNTQSACVSFDIRNLKAQLQRGDEIHRPKTGRTYRVTNPMPDADGRIKFMLSHIAGSDC